MARGLSVFVSIGAKYVPSFAATVNGAERRMGLFARRVKVQAAETKLAIREMRGAMSPLVGMAAAGGLSMGLKGIFGQGAGYQHEMTLMRNMGRTSKEVAAAVTAAKRTMFDVPTSTLNGSLKLLNETTLAYGGLGHALENLSFNSKMGALMKGVMGDGYDEAGGFNELVRALELRSGKMNSKDYQRQANGLFKAMVVSGGKVNPSEFLGFMQQAGIAARGWNENFLTRVAPSIIQEMGGERSGTALTAMFNQMQGRVGVGGKSITQEWQRLGLVPANGSADNLARNGWSPGALKGNSLAMANPLAWVEKVLFPALTARGININDKNQMLVQAQKMFGRETGKRVAATFFDPAQRARIHADMRLYDKASGVDRAYATALYNDPRMAGMAAANSLKNLETNLGKTLFSAGTVSAIANVSRAVNWMAGAFDRHPAFAKGVVGLMGFGAVAGTMKVFGIGLRWAFSPLWKLLFSVGPRNIGLVGWVLRGLSRLIPGVWRIAAALGPLLFRGLAALAPLVVQGVGAAFALLSNPVGWGILAAAAVVGAGVLIYRFRGAIGGFLSRAWGTIKGAFLSLPWASIGTAIADAMTFGLASKLPAIGGAIKGWWQAHAPTALGGSPAPAAKPAAPKPTAQIYRLPPIAGHRRKGGHVEAGKRYVVGEEGEEEFVPGRSGTIVPHSEVQRRRAERQAVHVGQIVIQGANDPQATARAVRREIQRMAARQSGYMGD